MLLVECVVVLVVSPVLAHFVVYIGLDSLSVMLLL